MNELKLGDLIIVWDTEDEGITPEKQFRRFVRWYGGCSGVVCFKEGVKTSPITNGLDIEHFENWEFL